MCNSFKLQKITLKSKILIYTTFLITGEVFLNDLVEPFEKHTNIHAKAIVSDGVYSTSTNLQIIFVNESTKALEFNDCSVNNPKTFYVKEDVSINTFVGKVSKSKIIGI